MFGCIADQKSAYIYAMDRIIYFYRARENSKDAEKEGVLPCHVHCYRRKGYELVRVGLKPWFIKWWEQNCRESKEAGIERNTEKALEKRRNSKRGRRLFDKGRFSRKIRRQTETEAAFFRQKFTCLIATIQQKMQNFYGEASEGNNSARTFFSYEESLKELLKPETETVWQQLWKVPEFDDYDSPFWMEHMFAYASEPYFVVRGWHRGLPELLCRYADRMKGLQLVLSEEDYSEALQEFLEDFYEEYGLAAMVTLLTEEQNQPMPFFPGKKVSVLDFSDRMPGEIKGLAAGSVWLDMRSIDAKSRYIECRNPEILCFSLKKEWKQPVLP